MIACVANSCVLQHCVLMPQPIDIRRAGWPASCQLFNHADTLPVLPATVYRSFGVLMWESYRRTPPWVKKPGGGYHHNRAFGKFGPETPLVFQRLCRRCLDPGPRNRPTFKEVRG